MSAARPRLLFLESLSYLAGGQTVLVEVLAALRERYASEVLLPGPGPLAERLRALGVACHFAPMGHYTLVRKTATDAARYALEAPRLALAALGLIRRTRAQLVYANSSRAFVWGTLAAALAGRGIVWHAHSVLAGAATLRLLRTLSRLRTVRRIVAVSAEAGRAFAGAAGKVVVVPSGVDLARFQPDRAAGQAARRRLGLPAGVPVVGLVGDLIPLKGQATLLEAARRLASAHPGTRFVLVGAARPDDPQSERYAETLRQQVRQAGLAERVCFAGRQDDMPSLYNALDVLVIASTTETVPLALLEALACGVPVLSTPVGRAPELLGNGAAGTLFPVGDTARLAALLAEWLAAPESLASRKASARARAEACCSLEAAVAQIAAVIDQALADSHDPVH